jgi:hypothetical protein
VVRQTFYNWRLKHPEFRAAVEGAKRDFDAEVEAGLFKSAVGYEHEAVEIMQHQGKPVVVPYVKHYPPNPASAIFWLKNRQPERWKEVVEHQVSGSVEFHSRLVRARERVREIEAPTIEHEAAE